MSFCVCLANKSGIQVAMERSYLSIVIYGTQRTCYWKSIMPRNRWTLLAFTWVQPSTLNVYIDWSISNKSVVCGEGSLGPRLSKISGYGLGSNNTNLWIYYDMLAIWHSVVQWEELKKIWNFLKEHGGDTTVSISVNLHNVTWDNDYALPSSSLHYQLKNRLYNNTQVPREHYQQTLLESFTPLQTLKQQIVTANLKFKFSETDAFDGFILQDVWSVLDTIFGKTELWNCSADDNFFCETPTLVDVIPASANSLGVYFRANYTGILENNFFKEHKIIYNVQDSVNYYTKSKLDLSRETLMSKPITTLLPYTYYCVRVSATSFKASGLTTQEKCVRTLESVPVISPGKVTGDDITSQSITVRWSLLNPKDSKIQGHLHGYRVKLSSINSSLSADEIIYVCASTHSLVFNNLVPSTTYNATVAAFTGAGFGPASHVVMTTKQKVVIVAQAPNVTVTNIDTNKVVLRWGLLKPVDSRIIGALLGYRVHLLWADNAPNFTRKTLFNCVNTSSVIIRNLWPDTRYNISVLAFNQEGLGNVTHISVKTTGKAPGKPPSSFKVCTTDDASVRVEWEEVDRFYEHGVILGYKIIYHEVNETKNESRTVDPNVHAMTITHLKPLTDYVIRLLAFNAHGESEALVVVAKTNSSLIPDAPTNVAVRNTSSTSLFVSWQRAVWSSMVGYRVSFGPADGSEAEHIFTCNTTAHLTGLAKYSLYNVSIRAFVRDGMSPPGESVLCRTDLDVPSLPPVHIKGFNTSTQSIFVQWEPVPRDSRGGELLGYILNHNKTTIHSRRKRRSIGQPSGTIRLPLALGNYTLKGLDTYALYSFRIAGYNSKGTGAWSPTVYIRTDQEVPQVPPLNVSARNTSSTSINVTWLAINPTLVKGLMTSYSVRYAQLDAHGNVTSTQHAIVPISQTSVQLTKLETYTNYSVTVGGVTKGIGVRSQPVVVRTSEGTPDMPPQNITIIATGHSSLRISWLPIPKPDINGILRGFELFYKKTQDFDSAPNITVRLTTDTSSYEVVNLAAFTAYSFWIRGYTSVGYGLASNITQGATDESVPSKAPANLTATNLTSDSSISVSWRPIPLDHVLGVLRGFRLHYKPVMLARNKVHGQERSLTLDPSALSAVISNLDNFAVYEIKVLGFTRKGDGVFSEPVYAETCPCAKVLSTSWHVTDPYVTYNKSTSEISGLIPSILGLIIGSCCGKCGHGQSHIDYLHDDQGKTAMKTNVTEFLSFDGLRTDLQFPVNGFEGKTMHGENSYVGIVTSPGVAFITVSAITKDAVSAILIQAALNSWTMIAVMLCMVWCVGIITWFLDKKDNPENFPPSFLKGAYNGIWMSFITITTLGYGDCVPKSVYARVLTIVNALMGFVLISLITANLSKDLVVTTIMADKRSLYMAKVGAISDSFEYRLGIRRNALVNTDRQYHSFHELRDAMASGEVEGILVDLYVSAKHQELFKLPKGTAKISKLLKYNNIFGIVLGGRSRPLDRCFNEYINYQRENVFKIIHSKVSQPDEPEENTAQTVSSGLVDPESENFRNMIKFSLLTIVTCFMTALVARVFSRVRERSAVNPSTESNSSKQTIQDMRKAVELLYTRISFAYQKLRRKHTEELGRFINQKGLVQKYGTSTRKLDPILTPADLYKKNLVTSGTSTA